MWSIATVCYRAGQLEAPRRRRGAAAPQDLGARRRMMSLEYLVGGLVSVALLVYLLWALLYPERF